MKSYLDMLNYVQILGKGSDDRTGVGTKKVFGYQFRHRMADGFPLLTTKKMFPLIVFVELCWMLGGNTNVQWLNDYGVTIWDEWANTDGDLGPIYGHQWRRWGQDLELTDGNEDPAPYLGIDQIKQVFYDLESNPDGRRHIVTAWNPTELPAMELPPCHLMFQFGHINGELNLHMVQRSADLFLGVPYNIAFYGAMLQLFSHCLGMIPGDLVISFSDLHIYNNHQAQVEKQLEQPILELPLLYIDGDVKLPWEARPSDFDVPDYKCGPVIKAPVAV